MLNEEVKPNLTCMFAIVDSKTSVKDIESIMKNDRFAIQNTDTQKVVIGMRWDSGQGLRYRPVIFKDGEITFGMARNSTFVSGIGISMFEEVMRAEMKEAVNPVSPQESQRFNDIIRKCDFGSGEPVIPTLFTDNL